MFLALKCLLLHKLKKISNSHCLQDRNSDNSNFHAARIWHVTTISFCSQISQFPFCSNGVRQWLSPPPPYQDHTSNDCTVRGHLSDGSTRIPSGNNKLTFVWLDHVVTWLWDLRKYIFQGILCVCRKGDEMGELTKQELARQHKWVNFPCWTSLLTFNKDHFGKPYRQKRPSRDWTDSAISEHSSHGYFVDGFELLFTSYLLNNFCNPALPLAC